MLNNFKATVKHGGISVTNQRGELVCYVMVEKTFIAPGVTQDEAREAGTVADEALEIAARNAGATSIVLVLSPEHPSFPEEKWIRIVEREIPQIVRKPEVDCRTQSHLIN